MKYNSISATHPANKFEYCPKCSSTNLAFSENKRFHCSNCNFTYYINGAAATCGIIELPDKRIVLTRRKFDPRAGSFDLPGGFVDILERAEDCMIREIKEELNIDVSNPIFLASFPNEYVFKDISYYTCDLAFVFKLKEIPVLKPSDDVSEAILIHPPEIDFNTISFPSIISVLKKYIEENM